MKKDSDTLFLVLRRAGVLPAFLVMIALFCIFSPSFRSPVNFVNILQQNTVIGIIACGMTFMLIIGGFDLSVGSVAALAGIISAFALRESLVLGILVGLATGAVMGAANGFLISRVGINAFVATLGTMVVGRGLVLIVGGGFPVMGFPSEYNVIGMGNLGFIPIATLIWMLIALACHILLRRTRFGQYVYAVGGNEKTAALSGINVKNMKFLAFVLGGVLAAAGGLVLLFRVMAALAYMASGYELRAIAACIVGGCILGGGKGSIPGTIIGVLLMGAVANALHIFGVSPYWEDTITGLIIISAVATQRLSK